MIPDIAHEIDFGQFQETTTAFNGMMETDMEDHRASFKAGRKPWHQFLHHLAPGSNADAMSTVSKTPGTGTRQIIPPGGLGLLREYENELNKIKKAVRPVCHCRSLNKITANSMKGQQEP